MMFLRIDRASWRVRGVLVFLELYMGYLLKVGKLNLYFDDMFVL